MLARLMRRLAIAILLAACATPEPTPPADAGQDAGACIVDKPCYAGCDEADGSCRQGHWREATCTCEALADGGVEQNAVTGIELETALPAKVPIGRALPMKVLARRQDGTTEDVTAAVRASLFGDRSEGIALPWIPDATGELVLSLTLTREGRSWTTTASTKVLAEEARAIWVTRFAYDSEADVRRIVNAAADARFNVVLFQIRGNGDAYYRSTLEPWAASLAGKLGEDPGWDPLQVAINAAHARGIELHAYYNVFSAWVTGTPPASPAGAPDHAVRAHPEWVERTSGGETVNDGYQWFAPGVEAVRAHNVAVAREILTKYAVDGLHLDRVRYATRDMGWNALERAAFAASGETDYDDWRTKQVNTMVRALFDVTRELRPKAKVSAAVWGIHTRLPGCTTSDGNRDLYQDSWAWAKDGYIDALCPMIYWAEGTGCTDFGDILQTFMQNRGERDVWAGLHAHDRDASCGGNCKLNWPAVATRVDVSRQQRAQGVAVFASSYMDAGATGNGGQSLWKLFGDGPFAEEALPPPAH